MSRYSFEDNDQRWHVGWDPGLASYFAQAEPLHPTTGATVDDRGGTDGSTIDLRDVDLRDHRKGDNHVDVDLDDELRDVVPGDRPGEVPTLAALTEQLQGQVVIPDAIREQLADDGPAYPDRHAAAAARRLDAVMKAAFPHPAGTRPGPSAHPPTGERPTRPPSQNRDQTPER